MTVVLLHPFPFDARLWALVAELLDRHDVVTPDLLGCGGRPVSDQAPSMAALAADVWERIGGVQRPVVIGMSLGGYVAMEMLRQRPLAGLGLVDTKVTSDDEAGRANRERLAASMEQRGQMELYASQALPALLGERTRAQRPQVVAQVSEWITQANPAAVAWLARAMADRPDSTSDLAGFDGPVLLVRGEQDAIATEADFAHMQTAAAEAIYVEIAGCGHLPAAENPVATADVLRRWLGTYW